MKIILRNGYIVDHESKKIEYKDIRSKEFDYYVRNLLINIDKSSKCSEYIITGDGTTQVINQCKLLTNLCLNGKDDKDEIDILKINQHTEIIAKRFLEKESAAQEKVIRMGKKIKVGCLIFAVIQKGAVFQLLIAKLESVGGLELIDFTHADIIEDNENKFGKACLMDVTCSGECIEISKIRILLDNKATYFTKEFLEIVPQYEDGYCTEKLVKTVLSIVDNRLREKFPRDRQLIRNSFIMHVRKNEFIDYDSVIQEVFTDYFNSELCEIDDDTKNKISSKLEELPEKQKFARQFIRIKDNIKAKLTKSEYKLSDDLDLVINESKIKNINEQDDIFERIISSEDLDGKTYLKIYTDNEDALKTFRKAD